MRLLCQQAVPSPVKGGSHAGKKITTAALSHGPPVCRPSGEKKSLITAIIFAIVRLEAKHTLSSLPSQQREEAQHQ